MADDSTHVNQPEGQSTDVENNGSIDELVDDVHRRNLWSPEKPITYGLLASILEAIEAKGKGSTERTFRQVIVRLNHNISLDNIPKLCNIKRKLKTKSIQLSLVVPWTECSATVGPRCSKNNITEGVLNGIIEAPGSVKLTNGIILELRSFLLKKRYMWKVFSRWLKTLGATENLLPQDVLRRKISRINDEYMSLILKHKETETLLSSEFVIPQCTALCSKPCSSSDTASQHTDNDSVEIDRSPPYTVLESCNSTFQEINKDLDVILGYESPTQQQTVELQNSLLSLQTRFQHTCTELTQVKCEVQKLKRNDKRKIHRRDQKIAEQRGLLAEKTMQLESMQQLCNEAVSGETKARKLSHYYKKKTAALQTTVQEGQAQRRVLDSQLAAKDEQIHQLTDHIHALLEEKLQIDTKTNGQYTDNIRETVMALGSLGISAQRISKVMDIVADKIFGVRLPDLPCETSVKNFLLEANILAKIQVCETMLSTKNSTLHSDGTTDHQRHFFAYQLSTPSHTYAMGISESVGSGAETQLNELRLIVEQFASFLCKSKDEQSEMVSQMILNLKNLMTDQHVVNRKFRDLLERLRFDLLERTISSWHSLSEGEKQKLVGLHQWFCFMHVLLGLADSTEAALAEYDVILSNDGVVAFGRAKDNPSCRQDNSTVTGLIKAVCSLLTPSGHPAAGVSQDFQAWMTNEDKKIHLVHFSHNRFNILFQNASATFHHHQDILHFLAATTHHSNQLIDAVRADISDEYIVACLRAVAIFHVCFTRPFHATVLGKDKCHILDLNPFLQSMALSLEKVSANPWCLLDLNFQILDCPLANDEIRKSVIPKPDDKHVEITLELLSLISTHCLVTFTRQVTSQLPGGIHGRDHPDLREESQSVPTSNSIGESQFGALKYLRRLRPNARIENIEATILWAYNKTSNWFASLSPDRRSVLLQSVRVLSKDFKARCSQRRKELQEQRTAVLQDKESQKEAKLLREASQKQKCLDTLRSVGGHVTTPEQVDNLVPESCDEKDLVIKLKDQIRFYKQVVKSPAVPRELYFFSQHGKQFNSVKLISQLKQILNLHTTYLNSSPQQSCSGIPSKEIRQRKIDKAKKIILCNYQSESSVPTSNSLRKGKKRKNEFPSNPVGKRFRHRWNVGKGKRWYSGTVLSEAPSAAEPSFSDDEHSNTATDSLYKLYTVVYDGETEELRICLEKDFWRQDLDFLESDNGML